MAWIRIPTGGCSGYWSWCLCSLSFDEANDQKDEPNNEGHPAQRSQGEPLKRALEQPHDARRNDHLGMWGGHHDRVDATAVNLELCCCCVFGRISCQGFVKSRCLDRNSAAVVRRDRHVDDTDVHWGEGSLSFVDAVRTFV